jgi:transcriptional regulator with XRE-family HTH domain
MTDVCQVLWKPLSRAAESPWMTEMERVEAGRRARAAIGYAGAKIPDVAAHLHMSPATLSRLLAGARKETTTDELWQIADYCKLPRDWYAADLTKLGQITREGAPRFGTSEALRAVMEQDLEERVLRARKRAAVGAKGTPGRRRRAPRS